MEPEEFQRILLKVQEFLSPAEVQELVFLCSDLLKKDLSSVTAARDLFSLLQDYDLLSANEPSLLPELLHILKRSSLVRDLHLETQPQVSCYRISPYRRLLYELAENISSDDLNNVKFLLKESLPRKKLQHDLTMLQLFLEMEKTNLLDADNLDTLESIIKEIHPKLKNLITKFNLEHAAGAIAQETKLRSNCNSLDSVTTKAVQSSPSLPSFPGDASRDVEGQIDKLSLRESQVQTQSGEFTSTAEETNLSSPDQRNQRDLPKLEEYNMTGDWRGFCLIINNYKFNGHSLKDRQGTDTDEKRLTEVFQWLGFKTQTVQDCDRTRMLEAVEELAACDHTRADCAVCCVLTHGYDGGVYGVDGSEVALRELLEPLSGQRCSQLGHKPKLFFIQACQGTKSQGLVFLQSDGHDSGSGANSGIFCDAAVPRNSIPSDAHFLMALATVPFYTSYRDKVKGTWFIQTLCENLLQMVPRGIDLLSILTQVNNDVSKKTDPSGTKKQIPQPGFTLTKRVIFPVPKQPPPS